MCCGSRRRFLSLPETGPVDWKWFFFFYSFLPWERYYYIIWTKGCLFSLSNPFWQKKQNIYQHLRGVEGVGEHGVKNKESQPDFHVFCCLFSIQQPQIWVREVTDVILSQALIWLRPYATQRYGNHRVSVCFFAFLRRHHLHCIHPPKAFLLSSGAFGHFRAGPTQQKASVVQNELD